MWHNAYRLAAIAFIYSINIYFTLTGIGFDEEDISMAKRQWVLPIFKTTTIKFRSNHNI